MNHRLIGYIASSDKEVIANVLAELHEMNYDVFTDNTNFVFGVPSTENITPVMLMAHIDTVRDNDNVVVAQFADTLYAANGDECGALGADDRAGVYICLEIAKRLTDKPYMLFTTGEETGHIGAATFCRTPHPEWDAVPSEFYSGKNLIEPYLDDIYCIMQYDRRGMHDVVAYGAARQQSDLINKALLFGYKLELGSTSDCRNITEVYKVAHLNFSAGFLHEHSPQELLILPALDFAITNGVNIAQTIDKPYRVPREALFSGWPTTKKFVGPVKPEAPSLGDDVVIQPICDVCGKHRKSVRFHEVGVYVCDTCLRRIGGGSSLEGHIKLTFSSLLEHKMNLEMQRAASKSRNKESNLPFVPSCPVDSSHQNVTPEENGCFWCDDCGTTFYQTKEGTYWWDMATSTDAYFRYHDNPVTIFHVMPEDEVCPLNNCNICGKLIPDEYLSYYETSDTKELLFAVCDNCNAIDNTRRM